MPRTKPKRQGHVADRTAAITMEAREELLDHLAEGGSVRGWCRETSHAKSSVYRVCIDDPEYARRFKEARRMGAADHMDEALEIARTPMIGESITEDPDGRITTRREDMFAHRKHLTETLLKRAACFAPDEFGLRVQNQVHHSGGVTLEKLVLQSLADAPKTEQDEPEEDGS